jgi:DNA repair exonuclease SbcCD ATPase subunit
MAEQEWKDQVITTGVDKLMEYLRKEREVRVDEAARSLEVDTDTIITWAKSLQESGLAELEYTARSGRIVRILEDETKSEEVIEDMQDEVSETVEQLADLGRERARIDRFHDVLSRLQAYLEKDEAFVAELKDERDDISDDLDELTTFIEDLDTVEDDVDDLQRHLEQLQRDIDVLTKLDRLKEQAVGDADSGDDDTGTGMGPLYPLKRLAAALPSFGRLRGGGGGATCDVCGKTFDTEQGLETHRQVTGHEPDDTGGDAGATETFKCPECDRVFQSEHGLRTHMGMAHDEKYDPDDAE